MPKELGFCRQDSPWLETSFDLEKDFYAINLGNLYLLYFTIIIFICYILL